MWGVKQIFAKNRVSVAAYSIVFNMGFSFCVGVHGLLFHRADAHALDAILLLTVPPIIAALCIWLPGEAA